ncbi:MAG: hypothetical protein AB8B72_11270 [Crocinitomicaceae bacterium]
MAFTCFCLLVGSVSFSQNLDKIGKKDMVKINGGINLNTIGYASAGLPMPNRDPLAWFATGKVNISILDVALPFTFTYSNQNTRFSQPFNQTALHPSYKWIKTHIGNVNMNFSPYTLSGHTFLGGGVELTPGKWKIKLMGGRLNRTVNYDFALDNLNQIVFKRMGYGLSVGYEKNGYSGEAILFKAVDDRNSLNFMPLNTDVKPQDNFVASLIGKAKIIENMHLTAEYSLSGLTQNTNYELGVEEAVNTSIFNGLVNANATTDYFNAFKTSLAYKLKIMSFSFNFEHVDPGYKTLGGFFFNNDLRNYTFAPSFTLFKNKLNIGANTGYQINNLAGDKGSTTSRWVGSLNASYAPTKAINIVGSYSNFSTFTRNRPNTDPFYYQPADTLNFYQLTQNAMASIGYRFGESKNKSAVQLMYNYQESYNLSGNILDASAFGINVENDSEPANVHASNLSYTLQFTEKAMGITFAANANYTSFFATQSLFVGPTINFQKSLFEKKSSLSIGSTYNRQINNSLLVGNVFNHRVSFTFAPKIENKKIGKVNLSLNGNLMQRLPTSSSITKIAEMNVFVNMAYSF